MVGWWLGWGVTVLGGVGRTAFGKVSGWVEDAGEGFQEGRILFAPAGITDEGME